MGRRTGIEWADATWNPWYGCTKVSNGCRDCYAEREMSRFGRNFNIVTKAARTTFLAPFSWTAPRRIFCCSWGDFFHEAADAWRDEAWQVIADCPQHTFLILTKRPERINAVLPTGWADGWPNVWLGVTAENQREAERRIPVLATVPARHRFVSAEPLLESLKLWDLLMLKYGPEWLIAGGESGSTARWTDQDWLRSIRDQCHMAHIPFFLKQLGGSKRIDGAWGGRLLDGWEWNGLPPEFAAFVKEPHV